MTLLIPEKDTLVTYYLLPLIDVNKVVFGKTFKTSFVDMKGENIYVELKRNMISPIYKNRVAYRCEVVIPDGFFIKFEVPKKYLTDVKLFINGKYSKMSRDAKRVIYTSSTLPYNQTMDDFKMTHPILHALGNTKKLRAFLIDYLDVKVIPETEELIDKPDESWFIEYRFKHG